MIILKKTYKNILYYLSNSTREVGGILGGYNGIITDFIFDKGMYNQNIGTYIPNVHFLNAYIEKWQSQNINLYGIIHNHLTEYAELSNEDIRCVETIMNSMPLQIEYLYFPVISSKNILNAFKVTRTDKGICIVSENISTIERSV